MERLRKKQITWLSACMQENTKQHPMEGGLFPMEGFIDAEWEMSKIEFVRCCWVVILVQKSMDVEGKDYPLTAKSHAYGRMSMPYHTEFHEHLQL